MALVDYGGSSSDSDSGNEEEVSTSVPILKNQLKSNTTSSTSNNKQEIHINNNSQPSSLSSQKELSNVEETSSPIDLIDFDEVDDFQQKNGTTFKLNLPETKQNRQFSIAEEEEDDEFLKKKAIPIDEKPPPPPQQKPLLSTTVAVSNSGIKSSGKKSTSSGPVKIILPALSTFGELKIKEKPMITVAPNNNKLTTGLLDMLPKPKSSAFIKISSSSSATTNRLVPDSISRPKPSAVKVVTKIDIKSIKTTTSTKITAPVTGSDSEESDSEDFFSLNREDVLPEVSQEEISAMVANKSAKLREAQQKISLAQKRPANENLLTTQDQEGEQQSYQQYNEEIENEAIQALCGRQQAKRAKRGEPSSVNIIDLSSDQVNPNRDEWMRSQLQATTEYQPRGMVDEDPGAGTKRKHQITYLAHQAKANEQELQAMWAANRHARRQTQSKYGF